MRHCDQTSTVRGLDSAPHQEDPTRRRAAAPTSPPSLAGRLAPACPTTTGSGGASQLLSTVSSTVTDKLRRLTLLLFPSRQEQPVDPLGPSASARRSSMTHLVSRLASPSSSSLSSSGAVHAWGNAGPTEFAGATLSRPGSPSFSFFASSFALLPLDTADFASFALDSCDLDPARCPTRQCRLAGAPSTASPARPPRSSSLRPPALSRSTTTSRPTRSTAPHGSVSLMSRTATSASASPPVRLELLSLPHLAASRTNSRLTLRSLARRGLRLPRGDAQQPDGPRRHAGLAPLHAEADGGHGRRLLRSAARDGRHQLCASCSSCPTLTKDS